MDEFFLKWGNLLSSETITCAFIKTLYPLEKRTQVFFTTEPGNRLCELRKRYAVRVFLRIFTSVENKRLFLSGDIHCETADMFLRFHENINNSLRYV